MSDELRQRGRQHDRAQDGRDAADQRRRRQLYAEFGLPEVKTSWVMELLRLHAEGPMTITELAQSVQRTHSAISQKVTAMRAAELVRTGPGPDGRSKTVSLTPKALAVVDQLAAEWRATEAASAELEAELPYPLSRVVDDMAAALARRSFRERILAHLETPPVS